MKIILILLFLISVLCPQYGFGQSQVYVLGTAGAEINMIFPFEGEIGTKESNSHMHIAPLAVVISEDLSEAFTGMGVGVHLEGEIFELHSGILYDAPEENLGGFFGFEITPRNWLVALHSEFASAKNLTFSFLGEWQMNEHCGVGPLGQITLDGAISSYGMGPTFRVRLSEHMIRFFGLFARAEVQESEENPLDVSNFHFLHFGVEFELHFHL